MGEDHGKGRTTMMTAEDWADGTLADAEIAVVREELIEMLANVCMAQAFGDLNVAQDRAAQAMEFLLTSLDGWQVVRFLFRELYPEYSYRAQQILGDVPRE